MHTEEHTRTEVIKSLIASNAALILLLQERYVDANNLDESTGKIMPLGDLIGPALSDKNLTPAQQMAQEMIAQKAKRVKKAAAKNPQEPALVEQDLKNAIARGEVKPAKMEEIKPVKPGKTLADLRVALQECITKHGMPVAKDRLAPFTKVSDVPDDKIADVIKELVAA